MEYSGLSHMLKPVFDEFPFYYRAEIGTIFFLSQLFNPIFFAISDYLSYRNIVLLSMIYHSMMVFPEKTTIFCFRRGTNLKSKSKDGVPGFPVGQ